MEPVWEAAGEITDDSMAALCLPVFLEIEFELWDGETPAIVLVAVPALTLPLLCCYLNELGFI